MVTPSAPPSPRLSATACQRPNESARAPPAHVPREAASPEPKRKRSFRVGAERLGQEEAVGLERRPLRRRRRIAPWRPEVDEAEEPLAVGQADRVAPRLRAQHQWCPPVARESARVRREEHCVDRARGRADVLLVLLEVPDQYSGGNDERRRTLELRSFGGACRLLEPRQGLGAEHAEAP